jgi:hypothetical protein
MWAQTPPEDPSAAMITMVRVIGGMGIGGVMAGAFFYLLFRQGDSYKEELRIVRRERKEDLARMQAQIDLLYRSLNIPPLPLENNKRGTSEEG